MGIVEKFLSFFRPSGATKTTARSPNPAYAILRSAARSGSSLGAGDIDHYMRIAITNPHVLSSIIVIADRVASIDNFLVKIRHDKRGGWLDLTSHPMLDLLRNPNDMMTGSFLLGDVPWTEPLQGNAYWFVVSEYPGAGKPTELWPLPVHRIRPRPDKLRISAVTGKLVIDYEYMFDSSIILPGENVIHFRTNNPYSQWEGLSKLTALQLNLDSSYAESHWLATHFGEDNAVPAAVISLPPELDEDQFKLIEGDIRTQFGGRSRTAITRAGTMDVKVIQHSIAEMQVLEHLNYSAAEIRRVFKIPDGLNEASSGQSRLAAEQALARDAIQPMCNHIADVLTHALAPFYNVGDREVMIVADDLVPADRAMDVSEYGSYSSARTLNENRKELGLPPLRLSGKLEKFQILLDEVPLMYAQMMTPALDASSALGLPGTAQGALNGTGDSMGGEDRPGLPGGFSSKEQEMISAMTGAPARPRQLTAAPLKDIEQEAILLAALNTIQRGVTR